MRREPVDGWVYTSAYPHVILFLMLYPAMQRAILLFYFVVLYLLNVWRSYGFIFLLSIDRDQSRGILCIILVTTTDRLITVNKNWGISC